MGEWNEFGGIGFKRSRFWRLRRFLAKLMRRPARFEPSPVDASAHSPTEEA